MPAYVFGYASLVALEDAGAMPGRLRGWRRRWGVAMDNWEGGAGAKHWLDRATGERPRIRVAYLDIYERPGSAVNGLALPVDEGRLAELDAREVNYERVEVTEVHVVPSAEILVGRRLHLRRPGRRSRAPPPGRCGRQRLRQPRLRCGRAARF